MRAVRPGFSPFPYGLFVLAVAWLINAKVLFIGWDSTLLGVHEFRQLQTAISALYYPGGLDGLRYLTPLLGPPWSIPQEFPFHQATAVWISGMADLPLDLSGRLASWLFFQAALPAFYLFLGSIGLPRSTRWIPLSLILTSPIYLFFSRSFLIESCVFCFAMWFLAAYCRYLRNAAAGWLFVAAIAGSLAAAVKPTTMVVFSVAACLFTLRVLFVEAPDAAQRRRILGRMVALFSVPLVLGLTWLLFAASLRAQNPETAILETIFGFFGFGDLPQRLSFAYWEWTVNVWRRGITSEAGLTLLFVLGLITPPGRRWLLIGVLLAFLSGQLVFSNLYFVHEYYFYASGAFLITALGIVLQQPVWGHRMSAGLQTVVVCFVIATQLSLYRDRYLEDQAKNVPVPEIVDIVQDLTTPEDIIVVLGADWNAGVPYYAQRKALMLTAGREHNPAAVKQSIERLDPATVGAVIMYGRFPNQRQFIHETMSSLNLGPEPLVTSDKLQIDIWVPSSRHAALRETLPLTPYRDYLVAPRAPDAAGRIVVGRREITRLPAFARFSPRPVEAAAPGGFPLGTVDNVAVLNTHAPAALTLIAHEGQQNLFVEFGLNAGAYTNGNTTDGIELRITDRRGPQSTVLLTRLITPLSNENDRGTQRVTVALPPNPTGEILLEVLPGPQHNSSYDWGYVGQVSLTP